MTDIISEEEALQAWLIDVNRFEPLGSGPLIRDLKTDMVYDVVQFWIDAIERGLLKW